MAKYKYQFGSFDEANIHKMYKETGDKEILAAFVKNNNVLSDGFREFLGEVLTGKFKRKKPSKNKERDFQIAFDIWVHGGNHLRSGRSIDDGLALQVAKRFNILGRDGDFSEDAVIKIYQRHQGKKISFQEEGTEDLWREIRDFIKRVDK